MEALSVSDCGETVSEGSSVPHTGINDLRSVCLQQRREADRNQDSEFLSSKKNYNPAREAGKWSADFSVLCPVRWEALEIFQQISFPFKALSHIPRLYLHIFFMLLQSALRAVFLLVRS